MNEEDYNNDLRRFIIRWHTIVSDEIKEDSKDKEPPMKKRKKRKKKSKTSRSLTRK